MTNRSGTDEARDRTPARRPLARRVAGWLGATVVVGVALWLVYGVGIDTIVVKIQDLPPVLVVTLVFLLPALEASAFVGVIFPGEVAVLVGGVAASNGKVPFVAVLVAACLGAVLGDQVGYVVGREWGAQLLGRVPDRLLDAERLDSTQQFIRRLGAKGVVIGRWTAALRAFVPGLAGMSRMPYPRFLAANVLGGVGWATICASLGYVAGAHFHTIETWLGHASTVLLGVVFVGLVGGHFLHRRRAARDRNVVEFPGSVDGPGASDDDDEGDAADRGDDATAAARPQHSDTA